MKVLPEFASLFHNSQTMSGKFKDYQQHLGESERFLSLVKSTRKRKYDQIEKDEKKEEIEDLSRKIQSYDNQIESLKREIIEWKERDEANLDNFEKLL